MSQKKSGLGKGLGALLPADPLEEDPSPQIARTRLYNFEERVRLAGRISEIPLERISPNPLQPRSDFEEDGLQQLASSIRQLGIIQPVTVRALGHDRFELISGERRLRAALIAGLDKIPAFVRTADTESMLEMAIVENVQREALNPIEIALGFRRLIDECDLRQEDVATKVGKNRTTVANFLRLLKLPSSVQAAVRDRSVSIGHARALLALASEKQQTELLQEIIRDGLSVRTVEDRVRSLLDAADASNAINTGKKKKASTSVQYKTNPELDALRDRLRRAFSTQVHLRPSARGKGGKIELEYYSEEDLNRLAELLLRS